ncbi:hypothetical protein GCK32_019216 [Trichostrongylus colubriformis]|uniref:Uncharacterized protein n=1 Tax=Trichostrongylus colubriformis TaxID=6319 RepID=A0AAN8FH82_TRICO
MVQIGTTSFGNSCKNNFNHTFYDADEIGYYGYYFTDMRQHLDWICDKTGVCSEDMQKEKARKKKRNRSFAVFSAEIRKSL